MTIPSFGRSLLPAWPLDPGLHYLNHGTVGVTPRRTLLRQQQLRDEMEAQPAAFMLRQVTPMIGEGPQAPGRLRHAAAQIAAFVGADAADLGFVINATAAVNAVVRAFPLGAGDEVVLLDHAYGAVVNAARTIAAAHGASVVIATLPHPITDPGQVVDAFRAALTPRTRLAIIDHITSSSALLLPLAALVEEAHAHGVAVLVDGAHAPGAIPLDLRTLDADFYAANLHKWAWAPRSCGFLWARRDRQAGLHAPILSWGVDLGLAAELDWQGTIDPTPMLAAPAGLAWMTELGVDAVRAWNHELAWAAGVSLSARWGTTLATPETMVGTMVTIPLPAALGSTRADALRLRDRLLHTHRIEVQLHEAHGGLHARVSAQIYNDHSDIDRLGRAVEAALEAP